MLCEISKFTDDTKIASRVNTLNDIRSMQRILDKLVAWTNRWDMDFSINKCGVIHKRNINLEFQYQMNDDWVKSVDEERDLRVLMSKDLNFSKQCLLPKHKANLMLDIINRGILYESADVISKLYKSYFKPHLGYCI